MKDFLKWVMCGAVFAVPFVLLIVSSSMFFPFITGKNFAFRILVEIGFAAWALLSLYDRDYRPRWSLVLISILSMIVVMFAAALFGEYPMKSLWSNLERMEGWVNLAHFFMYFLLLGAALKNEELWTRFLNITLVAAVIMSLYALGQIAGAVDVSQGAAWRVDGRLGNSSYLGVYMLFNMFIAAWLFVRTKSSNLRYLYGALFFVFGFIMMRTGTRGAVLGFVGGSVIAFSYLALMAKKGAAIKKWALGGLMTVVLIAGGLWMMGDTAFVKDNVMLNRFANLSLSEGNIRFAVWQLALEGFKEKPILGWGQENFSYVFNKYYDPRLYGAEPWYDRTHNIFMDWLIAGGVLGLASYLFVLATALWHAVLRPALSRFKKGVVDESKFSVTEQALILGLLAAYMFHNMFVFDNLASWIFYAILLALIHSRVSLPWPKAVAFSVNQESWERLYAPVGLVTALAIVYFVNAPGILVAKDIIATYRAPTAAESLARFETALRRDSFAEQEIVEQMTQVGAEKILSNTVSPADKEKFRNKTEKALNELIADKPGDARVHLIAGGFYRLTGDLEKALVELKRAEELSPRKQSILEDQALVLLVMGENEKAVELYRRSYELNEDNLQGRVRLAAAMLYSGDEAGFREIIDITTLERDSAFWHAVITDDLLFRLAYQKERYDIVQYLLEERKYLYPDDASVRTNLAALRLDQGDKEGAIEILREAITDIPSFKVQGEDLIESLEVEE